MNAPELVLVPPLTDEQRRERRRAQARAASRARWARLTPEQKKAHRRSCGLMTPEQRAASRKHHAEQQAKWRADHPDLNHARQAEWRKRHPADPARRQEVIRLHRYGLTPESFEVLLQIQEGVCGICRKPLVLTRGARGTHVDHDHETGRVRGLLCGHCNIGIGHLGESPARLIAAARYLRPKKTREE